jgi:radical SAM protein with 4Fe4S-binding SPASM domain
MESGSRGPDGTEVEVSFEGFPFIVGWELTLLCDLRCTHCGSSAGKARADELTTEEALKICEQLPALLVQEVDLTGGEPLLRPDWPVIAARLIELGIPTNVLTNGLHVGADKVARMREIGISGVGISLDGLEKTHDFTRDYKGSFSAVLQSIALMQRAGLPLNVITTVNALNLPELPEMFELLRSAGVRTWRLQPVIPMGRVQSHSELRLDSEAILQLGLLIRELKRGAGRDDLAIICSDGLEYVDEQDDGGRPWQGCSAGIVSCGIMSNGKVKGCLSLPDEMVEGDLRERSLWDIWFHRDSFAYTRGFSREQLGANCVTCEKGEECKGGCSSNSYCATGRFHNDPFCFYKAHRGSTGVSDQPARLDS